MIKLKLTGVPVAVMVFVAFVMFIINAMIPAWILMIGIGMWHAHAPSVPTIGFWPAFVVMLAVWAVLNNTTSKD